MKLSFKKLFFGISFLSLIFGFCGLTYVFGKDENMSLNSTPKVSIVFPVYNVEPYLDQALNSAENQTLKDIEIICVNDGSTDNSLEILENHAKNDKRIKVINQKNKGASGARNAGMKAASGEYIYFSDADDVMVPYAMEKSVEHLDKYNADVLEFNYIRYNYKMPLDPTSCSYKDNQIKVCDYEEGKNPFDIFRTRTVAPWAYVYRRSFLTDNKLNFKEGIRIHEDILFTDLVKSCLKRLIKDNNVGYLTRGGRLGSIINTDGQVVSKRLNGLLSIIHELALNKDRFKFPGSNEHLLGIMLGLVYDCVDKMENKYEQRFYAQRAYEEIWKNFGEKYKVSLNKGNKSKLNNLKRLFENAADDMKKEIVGDDKKSEDNNDNKKTERPKIDIGIEKPQKVERKAPQVKKANKKSESPKIDIGVENPQKVERKAPQVKKANKKATPNKKRGKTKAATKVKTETKNKKREKNDSIKKH